MAERASTNSAVMTGPAPPMPALVRDLQAGLSVFLVALPLCLGIATAAGAPPLAGLVAGVVGGTVVAMASGSPLSVSGPAAGLSLIILDGIRVLGFNTFLTAVMLGGALQLALGFLGVGRLAHLVPNAVIRGMLAAIGLILVLKQLPHAIGYDADPEGDFAFLQRDGRNTFSELLYALDHVVLGAIAVSLSAALALYLWRDYRKLPLARWIPRELTAVLVGVGTAFALDGTAFTLVGEHRVNIPLLHVDGLRGLWTAPDWGAITRPDVWRTAFTLALVASVESLLAIEAVDRVDPLQRISPTNRELLAQGCGNLTSGLLGGLPVAAVIVRSFTNVQAGARTRTAAITQGVLLLIAMLALAPLLNHIPLAALAVLLLFVGFKLTHPGLYVEVWRMGRDQFYPFIGTVLAILTTDLLSGTLLGMTFALFFIVWGQYKTAIVITDDGNYRLIRFAASVSFLHKPRLKEAFASARNGSHVILDGTRAEKVDADIMETIADFQKRASAQGVDFSITRSQSALHSFFRELASTP